MENIEEEIYKIPNQEIIDLAKDLRRKTWHYNYWAEWFRITTNKFWKKLYVL